MVAADPRHLDADLGVVAVQHTWGQNLHHHPHVHCVVPGGGPSLDGTRWVACRPGFFLPVRVLSRVFRRLFPAELQAAFEAGGLGFFGDLAGLAEPAAFTRRGDPATLPDTLSAAETTLTALGVPPTPDDPAELVAHKGVSRARRPEGT